MVPSNIKYIILFATMITVLMACNQKSGETQKEPELTIFETISQHEQLSTLTKALRTADLAGILDGKGPYTIFAPTDSAFKNLPEGTLKLFLKKPELKEDLVETLKIHIVKGTVMFSQLEDDQQLPTLFSQKMTLAVVKEKDYTTVSQGKILQADIRATNGVIHIVDRYLVHLRPAKEYKHVVKN